jgi:hypothetical protein
MSTVIGVSLCILTAALLLTVVLAVGDAFS